MKFKFRRLLERPLFVAEIEVTYRARPPDVRRYTDTTPPPGGVVQWSWQVIELHRPERATVAQLVAAEAALEMEENFHLTLADWCDQDFAKRDVR